MSEAGTLQQILTEQNLLETTELKINGKPDETDLVARVDAVDQANVTVLPLADADLTHTVYMGYIRDKYQIPAVKRFIQFVKRDGKAY